MYVLITGGTNGIGLAAARELAKSGARIGLVARNRAKAEGVAAELGGADVFEADLTSQASIRTMTAEVVERAPAIDVLANNAGAMYADKKRIDPSPAAQDRQAAERLWKTLEAQVSGQ